MTNKPEETDKRAPAQPCPCMRDPFADLPPELVPQPAPKKDSLRRVTCPGCGRVYQTNRKTDLCIDCEYKGIRLPEPHVMPEGLSKVPDKEGNE